MKQLGDFKFRLPEPPATLVECKTDLESTAWALQKLLECDDDDTHQLLEKHSVGTCLLFPLRIPSGIFWIDALH